MNMITSFIKKLINRKGIQKTREDAQQAEYLGYCIRKDAENLLAAATDADTTDLISAKPAEIIAVKLRKSDYQNLSKFLLRIGLVEGTQASPDKVYVSKVDMQKFRAAATAHGRKNGLKGKALEMAVGMEMLNLSPNGKLENVLKSGYAVVIK
jgi:hypothetical protein